MDIQHLARGVAREEHDRYKRKMDIAWAILQTILVIAVAWMFIASIWYGI